MELDKYNYGTKVLHDFNIVYTKNIMEKVTNRFMKGGFYLSIVNFEKILFFSLLVSFLIPLSINIRIIELYVWNIPAFLILLLYTIRLILNPRIRITFDLWYFSCFVLIGFLFIFTILGINLDENWPFFAQFAISIIFAMYVRRIWGDILTEKLLIKFSIIFLFIQSFVGIIQQLTSSQFGNVKSYFGEIVEKEISVLDPTISLSRILGTLDQPNIFGNWIIVLFPFVILGLYHKEYYQINSFYFIAAIIAIPLSMICLSFTFSVGNIGIFILLSIAFLTWILIKKLFSSNLLKSNKATIYILCFFLMAIGITFVKYGDKIELASKALEFRIEQKGDVKSFGSTSFRMEMNQSAIKYFFKHPLNGVGYGNSSNIYNQVKSTIPAWWEARVHNVYLAILIEGGLIAMIAYMCYSIIPLVKTLKIKEDKIKYAFLFSLFASLGMIQIYLTPTLPEFAPLHSLLIGSALGFSNKQGIDE